MKIHMTLTLTVDDHGFYNIRENFNPLPGRLAPGEYVVGLDVEGREPTLSELAEQAWKETADYGKVVERVIEEYEKRKRESVVIDLGGRR